MVSSSGAHRDEDIAERGGTGEPPGCRYSAVAKINSAFREVSPGTPSGFKEGGRFLACGAKSSAASTGTMISPLGMKRCSGMGRSSCSQEMNANRRDGPPCLQGSIAVTLGGSLSLFGTQMRPNPEAMSVGEIPTEAACGSLRSVFRSTRVTESPS